MPAAGLPLHQLFGACRDRIRTYASGGLWLSQPIDSLVEEATGFVDAGFRAVKIRLGSADIADDLARVKAVREAIGADIELLADANQSLDLKKAMRLGRELEAFDLAWFEEPLPYHDLRGCAALRTALLTRIAAGETGYLAKGSICLEQGRAIVGMPFDTIGIMAQILTRVSNRLEGDARCIGQTGDQLE